MAGAAVGRPGARCHSSPVPPAHLWIGGFIVFHSLGQPPGMERYINIPSTSYLCYLCIEHDET